MYVIVNYVNFKKNYSFFQSSINEEMSFGTYRGLILRSQLIVLLKQRVKTLLSSCIVTQNIHISVFPKLSFLRSNFIKTVAPAESVANFDIYLSKGAYVVNG